MFAYYKRYAIISCVVAVAVPLAVSTAYAAVTGKIMAASLDGLIVLLLLLFGTMALMQGVFARRVDGRTAQLLALYNDDCNPEAFVEQGRAVADAITEPYDVTGSWFMTYYGQALLDAGKADQARKVAEALRESVAAARKPQAKVGIIANAVPLVAKVDGPKAALDLVGEGLELAGGQDADPADSRVVFLRGQQRLRQAEAADDDAELRSFYEKSVADAAVPERLRVESAWKLARLAFRSDDAATERRMLRYVVGHGGKLALVAPARKQLDALGDA